MLSLSKQGYNEVYLFRHEDAKPQRKTKAALRKWCHAEPVEAGSQ